MDLSSEKRPFPSFPSTIFTQQPKTFEQWQLALKGVKLLHLKRQYKQCAARSNRLLEEARGNVHSVHQTFLHFYIAASYETLGRTTHNLSSNKLPYLTYAKDAYAAGIAALPMPDLARVSEVQSDHESISSSSPALSEAGSVFDPNIHTITPPSDSLLPSPSYPTTERSSIGSASSLSNSNRASNDSTTDAPAEDATSLMPKPLRIRKTVQFAEPPLAPRPLRIPPTSSSSTHHKPAALALPPTISISTSHATLLTKSASGSISYYLLSRSLERYNTHLQSFRPHLTSHITSLDSLIEKTVAAQREHKASKTKRLASFWSLEAGRAAKNAKQSAKREDGNDEEEMGREDKKARVERLRKNGWRIDIGKRGFKGEKYYEELCAKALGELYDQGGGK